jgi:glycosyltransferase involved in cell wall biosynthesis
MASISKVDSDDSTQPPIVDIVIPYYKNFEYLKESIASVLHQTLTNFRLIIIDDATGDPQVAEYIKELKDSRVTYISNSKNIGLAGNFEKSRMTISSKWGVILGQDDLLLPSYLEEMTAAAIDFPNAAIIQPIVEVINDKGEVVWTIIDTVKNLIRSCTGFLAAGWRPFKSSEAIFVSSALASKAIMVGDFLYFPTLMWENSYLSKHHFRQDLEITLDIELIVSLFQMGAGLLLVEKPLAQYRRHSASRSGIPEQKINRLSEEVSLYKELAQRLKGGRFLKLLAYLHLSTRLHALVECIKSITKLNFSEAGKFLVLVLI